MSHITTALPQSAKGVMASAFVVGKKCAKPKHVYSSQVVSFCLYGCEKQNISGLPRTEDQYQVLYTLNIFLKYCEVLTYV